MPRTADANQKIRQAQHTKILAGARMVFAQKGMTATMSDVAAAAKVSQGLAYRYFESKDAIYKELVEQTVQSTQMIIQQTLEMQGTPMERLNILVSGMLKKDPERLEIYQLGIQTFYDKATPENLRELLIKSSQGYQAVLRQLIVEGQESGDIIRVNPDALVSLLTACTSGLLAFASRHPEQYIEQMPEPGIILCMLKP